MQNVEGFSNVNINWGKLVDTINSADPLAQVDKASYNAETKSLTISTGGEKPQSVTISVPNLEAPATIDQGELDAFVSKLSTGQNLNFSEAELKEVSEKLSTLFAETLAEAGGVSPGSGTLFDIYQLMALMLTVAQKQRDASRDIRAAENEAIQNAIHQQAEQQRSAALTGMIAGLVVCVVQAGLQGLSIMKAGQAHSKQVEVAKQYGVSEARAELKEAKVAFAADKVKAQADIQSKLEALDDIAKIEDPKARADALTEFKATHGVEGATVEGARISVKRIGDETIMAHREATIRPKEMALHSAEAQMNASADFQNAAYNQTKWRSLNDIFAAVGSAAQGIVRSTTEKISADASEEGAARQKAEEELAQIKDIFMQNQEVIDKVLQLMSAVIQAESQSMRDIIQA